MSVWDWLDQCRRDFLASGDQERLRLTALYQQGYSFRETDPDQALALFSEGRRLAEQLGEPWWALFYDKFRIDAQVHFQRDFRQVLDLALQCAEEARKPDYAQFPLRRGVFDSLVAVYLGIDAEGYADAIVETLACLEKEITPGPSYDHFLLLSRQRQFALERERLAEARSVCLRELALAKNCSDPHAAAHFAAFVYCSLCRLAWRQENRLDLAEFARAAEESARRAEHQCELAEALAWQAVVGRQQGQIEQSLRTFRGAGGRMARLAMSPKEGFYEAQAAYFTLAENWPGVLQVRERELAALANKGRLLYECRTRIERCRLLARIGRPFDEHLPVAREEAKVAARKLRFPEKYLATIDGID